MKFPCMWILAKKYPKGFLIFEMTVSQRQVPHNHVQCRFKWSTCKPLLIWYIEVKIPNHIIYEKLSFAICNTILHFIALSLWLNFEWKPFILMLSYLLISCMLSISFYHFYTTWTKQTRRKHKHHWLSVEEIPLICFSTSPLD